MFSCTRCGYNCYRKADMVKHMQRRKPCSLIASPDATPRFICEWCNRAFKSRQSKWYHKKNHCQGPYQSSDVVCSSSEDATLRDEIQMLKSRLQELEDIKKSEASSDKHVHHHHHTTTTTTQNIINSNVNTTVVVNAFGKESMAHITSQFLDQCVLRRDKGLIELLEKIHFDPEHAENKNVVATNLKAPIVRVHNGATWRYERKDRVLNELVDRGHGIMQEHFDDHEDRLKEDMSETMFKCICKWMDNMHSRDKNTVESVLTDIYVLLLNAGMDAAAS
jgi:predicted Fe-Mo cluster-binding NifX family protein